MEAEDIEAKGGWELLQEPEANEAEGMEEEEGVFAQMWTQASYDLGDPVRFVGSPFEKARIVLEAAEKSQEWLEQAKEIMEKMTSDRVEEHQETEAVVAAHEER
jgi:hypothetical protein